MNLDITSAGRFRRNGYLRLPGIVPPERAARARRLLHQRMGRLASAAARAVAGNGDALVEATEAMGKSEGCDEIMGLFHRTPLKTLIEAAFASAVQPVLRAQLATNFPAEDSNVTNEAGYLNEDTPHFGWCGHLDGLWNGAIATPPAGEQLDPEREAAWNAEPSTNGMRKRHPEHNANLRNFTALVGVALSDQRAVGVGNLGLLRGGHRHMETFFRWQRDQGGPLGPDGPGWPRVDMTVPNGHGLVHYPPAVRNRYRRGAAQGADGKIWPKPTFMRLKPGDAVVVHFSTPHSASRVLGADPRLMVYFRCTSANRPEANLNVYPDALCDNWLEWRGLPGAEN